MTTKRFLAAWAAYLVVTFAGGAIWHLMLFEATYVRLGIFTRIKDPVIPLGLAAMLLQGAVLSYVYPMLARRERPVRDGLWFGFLAAVFIGSSAVLAEAGKNYVASLRTWLLLEWSYYLLQFLLSGLAIALVYSRRVQVRQAGGLTSA